MSATLQRAHWNGQPTHLGDLFRVTKVRGDKQFHAVCELWTHNLGWEVRLTINGDMPRNRLTILRRGIKPDSSNQRWSYSGQGVLG